MTRLGVLNLLLRHVAQPFLRRTKTPDRARRDFERTARLLFRVPAGVTVTDRIIEGPGRPLAVDLVCCPDAEQDRAILYFHGGGYVAGGARTHRALAARLSLLSGIEVHLPDYRLAQEAPFPAAFDDACAAWDDLMARGYGPGDVVLGGDSAGGGLALALLAHLLSRRQRPAGLFAFSPWTDLALESRSLDDNSGRDPILPRSRVEELVGIVLGGGDPRDPRVSPLHADWSSPPPVYLQASETEVLYDDSRRMAERLAAAGGRVRADYWPDAPHVWQLLDGWIPEARDALSRTAEFVWSCLNLPRR